MPTAVAVDLDDSRTHLDGAGFVTILAADVDGGSAAPDGLLSLVVTPDTFTCANIGANNVTLTITDVNMVSDSDTAIVTVRDVTPPAVATLDVTVVLDGTGNASISAADVDGGSFDNCSVASFSLDNSAFTTADLGANTVMLTVTDGSGNSASASATVTVVELLGATMTDALLIDNDFDGRVDPGDTIRYSVAISNPDDLSDVDATNAGFSIMPDANTALVVGSVTTSQGSVTTGNTGGDTSVSVDIGTIADGNTVIITFDVLVDNPYPAMDMDISAQGLVTADTSIMLSTDDPDDATSNADPTVTTSTDLPVELESFSID